MKKSILVFVAAFMISGLVLSGCSNQQDGSSNAASNSGATTGAPAAADKQGFTSKTGVISQAGDTIFIQEAGGQPEIIESYSVELSEYVGQTITVTGQFSGDTLFVSEVSQ